MKTQNAIKVNLLINGGITLVGVVNPYTATVDTCRVVSYRKFNGDYVLKLKAPKKWQTGPAYIFRSLEEVI